MDILTTNNLSVSYGNRKVLKDLSMNIMENKITAIIGPSGCGKSTLPKRSLRSSDPPIYRSIPANTPGERILSINS